MITADQENQRMLASVLGVSEEEAAVQLDKAISISTGDEFLRKFANEIRDQLKRTVKIVEADELCDLQIVVGKASSSGKAKRHLFVYLLADRVIASSRDLGLASEDVHGLKCVFAACYVAAVSLGKIIELKGITSFDDPFVVRFESLGFNDRLLETPVTLHSTVLIGAGAVGNGFVRALSHLRTFGELSIVDPKLVSDGNLNRCLFFDDGDQGQPKADVLAAKAKPSLANLALDPHVKTFGEFRQSKGRVKRVIVAVDSRRVRRSIQKELPIEVLDASTTGIEEVIVHSHRQLTRRACMACIYHHIIDEFSREREIARGLGVTLDDVKEGFIDARVADLIVKSHPDLNAVALIGKSFDSLFKQRCAEQALSNSAGHQVFAPFALVSNFAGALLAVELLRFENGLISDNNPNYFFTSPWRVPNPLARRNRPRYPDCEFCSVPESENALMLVWPELNALNE